MILDHGPHVGMTKPRFSGICPPFSVFRTPPKRHVVDTQTNNVALIVVDKCSVAGRTIRHSFHQADDFRVTGIKVVQVKLLWKELP